MQRMGIIALPLLVFSLTANRDRASNREIERVWAAALQSRT
jgi:hypothetical protein